MPVNVLTWLRAASPWGRTCAAGAPVPSQDFCASLECESVCLTQLQQGEGGSVSCLQSPASAEACKLASMGVLPGVELRVLQSYPAVVFRIGHADFAVDVHLARHVRVHRYREE